MRLSIRLPALVTALIAGLAFATTGPAAVSAAPAHARSAPTHAQGATAGSGTRLWEARFTAAGRGAFGSEVAVSPDGSVVFAAGAAQKRVHEPNGTPLEGTILAYHAGTGAVLWRASYNPGQRSYSDFRALAVSPDGSAVYATGGTAPASGKSQSAVTGAYNAATGAPIWTDVSAAPGPDRSIAVSPDGSTVFVTTGATGGTAAPNVVALNAATGAVRWTASVGIADQVIVSPDGATAFILGENASFIPVLAAYDAATGAAQWTDTLAPMSPASMAVSPDGSKVVVTGLARTAAGLSLLTRAYGAATGTVLWSRQYTGPNGASYGSMVTVSPDSATVFVAGATLTAGNLGQHIVAVWAYDAATGASVWQTTLPAFRLPTADDTDQIAVSPDGSKVFIGASANSGSPAGAYSAAAFDAATGATLWALGRHLSGTDWHSFSASMAVSPDGSQIFVTGTVDSPPPNQVGTMATVAYSS